MYRVYVTDAYYISKERGVLDWPENDKFERRLVEKHETVKEALDSVADWGSKWVLWNGLEIENEEGEEVYSDLPAIYKCECCGHEEYERITGGLYTMKDKEGNKLFPDIA